MVLDLVFLDVALHLQRGNFGATHGRSYMKDKSTAVDQDTFAFAKIAVRRHDRTAPASRTTRAATLLARARKYRVPDVIVAIARSDEPLVDTGAHERARSIRSHRHAGPDRARRASRSPIPENIPFWWERGAHNTWQVAPDDDRDARPTRALGQRVLRVVQADARRRSATTWTRRVTLAQSLAPVLNFGLLTEVHTYTYRTGDVMLSTAQDYRPGVFSEQIHAWQATLDEHAIVFTTHPKNEPHEDTRWLDSDGYWTGSGSTPRAAQHGAASIVIYAPQFAPSGAAPRSFAYLDYTHAYFPTERFDEVDAGRGTGRSGAGATATSRCGHGAPRTGARTIPTRVFTRGLTQPFDLVADGGRRQHLDRAGR